ncbi:helix-turn-helix domain-containing protein [Domibacillus sp. DTU_2020_1001157_1_SI_ALB_TIR_016]|uniref:helix-turn-helix domain-containing protein n=1 Tax=Domibacillus sp. DTU_2020_1001157_1_SI_ALB_TIR_016 TaxID=3077789 RepID=UPI003977AF95
MIYFKLDDFLRKHQLSRNRFSQMTGIRPNTINDMCNGNTKRVELETLNTIIKALNEISSEKMCVSDLMAYKEEDENGDSNVDDRNNIEIG